MTTGELEREIASALAGLQLAVGVLFGSRASVSGHPESGFDIAWPR